MSIATLSSVLGSPASTPQSQIPKGADKSQNAEVVLALKKIRQAHDLPALACAVVLNGHTVTQAAVGVRKYGADVPVTIKDQFHLGSCTKAMTATLIGMLVERGKVTWKTTLEQSFPDLAATTHPKLKDVTVEMMLAQRGGFAERSWPEGKTFADMHHLPGTPREQRQAYASLFLREAPDYEPGTKYVYSNVNYALLGIIVERLTNIAWEDYITQQLFQPLAITTAGFGAMGTAGKIDQPWQHLMNGTTHFPIEPGPMSDNPSVIAPAGTVHCAIGDWAKFVLAHVQEGRNRGSLLKPETFKKLHTTPFGGEYMAGWIATERDWGGGRVLMHAGSNNMNYAVVWMAPLKNFAVLAATNQGGDGAAQACDEVAAAMIGKFLKA
ncbi:MAG: serine hydrolase [Abitibacteriaceae bacterium]|nr:serine hydrolase [Abditibacteriaceae bacterium]